jgi:lysophospholipase L1-like esterase
MTTSIPSGDDGSTVSWAANCSRQTAGYETAAVSEHQPQVVIWLSSWEAGAHVVNGRVLRFDTPDGDAALLADFEASRQRLTAGGATLVMLTMPSRAERSDLGLADPAAAAVYVHLNSLFRQFAAANPQTVRVVDLARIVCPTGAPCPEHVDGVRLRPRDGVHFEGDGPAWVAPRLLDAIDRELHTPAS